MSSYSGEGTLSPHLYNDVQFSGLQRNEVQADELNIIFCQHSFTVSFTSKCVVDGVWMDCRSSNLSMRGGDGRDQVQPVG